MSYNFSEELTNVEKKYNIGQSDDYFNLDRKSVV